MEDDMSTGQGGTDLKHLLIDCKGVLKIVERSNRDRRRIALRLTELNADIIFRIIKGRLGDDPLGLWFQEMEVDPVNLLEVVRVITYREVRWNVQLLMVTKCRIEHFVFPQWDDQPDLIVVQQRVPGRVSAIWREDHRTYNQWINT